MADYRSTLTGTQMDSALLDMAEHNSEAYAVGERNGIAVASDDVTYHNNARYYAQIASSQIVGDASSAVRWDTDQSEALTDAQKAVARNNINAASDSDVVKITSQALTSAQQAQARANIMAGGSNRNLLDNWYFVGGGSQLGNGFFPINQRGQTSYSNGTNTTIDRWKTEYSALSVDADGITWTATGDNRQFVQIIENYKLIEGETYTATIDCDISAGSARLFVGGVGSPWPTVAGSTVNVSSGITKVTFTFARESGYTGKYKLALASVGSCTVKLRKFKLEKGTVSTLANDVPPNFGEELRKCKRYLRYVPLTRTPAVIGGNTAVVTLNGIEMAGVPTPALISAGGARDAGSMQNITSATVTGFTYNTPTVQFALAGNLNYVIGYVYDAVIQLSCEP